MNDDVRNIVLGLVAAGISASLGWLARTYLWKRKLRRKQAFFGLPDHSESLLVVNRDAGSPDLAVHRYDVFALLELSALIKDCGAHAEVITQDAYGQGPVRRSITSLRGAVRSGNSSGPMVDKDGRVVTTVFAATTSGPRGGFGVPNAIAREALDRSATSNGVSTGPCTG